MQKGTFQLQYALPMLMGSSLFQIQAYEEIPDRHSVFQYIAMFPKTSLKKDEYQQAYSTCNTYIVRVHS